MGSLSTFSSLVGIFSISNSRKWCKNLASLKKIWLALNATFLTLIPKENKPSTPSKFHPIALYNVLYKIITKIISNHLNPLVPSLISMEQTSYMEGWKIIDVILVAHETIHTLKISNKFGMILKLDLSKYFNKISWDCMKNTLIYFRFVGQWVN